MPVTARLSRLFYERLGEQVANELVDWFNAVDATYKAELREVNELNFARFDAKVSQRFAAFEQRMAQFEARIEQRMSQFEARIEKRLAEFEGAVRAEVAAIRVDLSAMEAKLERRLGEQTRAMYLAWAILLAAVVGLYVK